MILSVGLQELERDAGKMIEMGTVIRTAQLTLTEKIMTAEQTAVLYYSTSLSVIVCIMCVFDVCVCVCVSVCVGV